jgi:hypothetical protein
MVQACCGNCDCAAVLRSGVTWRASERTSYGAMSSGLRMVVLPGNSPRKWRNLLACRIGRALGVTDWLAYGMGAGARGML